MDFENYAERIKSLKDFDSFEQPKNEYENVGRFAVKKGEMVRTSVVKTKFSQLNNKRLYFPKTEKGQKIENCFWKEKEKLLEMKKKALEITLRLQIFNQILSLEPNIVNLNQKGDFKYLYPRKGKKTSKNIVFSGEWMK